MSIRCIGRRIIATTKKTAVSEVSCEDHVGDFFLLARRNPQRICSGEWNYQCSPISRPTDVTCDRFLFSIYMCITLHVSSVNRSSSGVPHRTYSLQFLCLCLSAALSCKKAVSYKTVPQTDINTEIGGSMYVEGLLMLSTWRSKHVELYIYR
jgi:hypothetical protein